MRMHEFGKKGNPVMVLVHGVLTPWQIWMPQVEAFKEKYHVYVVALNAHTEEEASEFISLEKEVKEIEGHLLERGIQKVDVLCGLSLGGVISHEIWRNGKISIDRLVLDGAPLVPFGKLPESIMANNYLSIIHKSKSRDSKVIESFKKQFLPEKYLESYLKIADYMSDTSMRNIVHAASVGKLCLKVENKSSILFLHGTRGNEVLSKKVAKLIKKNYPETQVICFKGDAHCYKAIYEPQKWIEVVADFLEDKRHYESR